MTNSATARVPDLPRVESRPAAKTGLAKWKTPAYWAVLLASAAVLGHGFLSQPKMASGVWEGDGPWTFIKFGLAYGTLTGLVILFARRQLVRSLLVLSAVVTCGAVGLGAPAAVIYLLFSAFVLGSLLARNQGDACLPTDLILATLVGLAVYMTLVELTAKLHVHFPAVHFLVLMVPLVLGRSQVRRCWHELRDATWDLELTDGYTCAAFSLAFFVPFTYLFWVLLPEVHFDSLTQHLVLPSYLAVNHSWPFDFHKFIWAVFPLGAEWLSTPAYLLGGEFASRLLNLSYLILGMLLVFNVSGSKLSKGAAWLVAALYASTPFLQLESTTLFVENLLALYLFAAFLALQRYRTSNDSRHFFSAVALAAAAVAVKVVGIFVVGVLAVVGIGMAWVYFRPKFFANRMAIVALFTFVGGAFPYVYAYHSTGNPVFPFMNALFKSPFYYSDHSYQDLHWVQHLRWSSLYDLTFNTQAFLESQNGAFGFQYLAFLPASLLAAATAGTSLGWTALLVFVVHFLAIFHFEAYIRYLYPCITFATVMMVVLFWEAKELSARLYSTICATAAGLVLLNLFFMPA